MAFLDVKLTKFITEYRVMGNYGMHGWEEEYSSRDYQDATERYREYLDNGPGMYKLGHAKVPNPHYGRFMVGMKVRTHPATSAWMQRFQGGTVTKVGREYVTVAWSMNPDITRKFWPQHLEPLGEME